MRPHATPKRDSAERASRSPPSRVRLVKHKRPSLREVFDEYAPFLWRALRHLGIAESDIEDAATCFESCFFPAGSSDSSFFCF